MNSNFLFGISLTTSFLAGTLALFAPCCITFLLPSYLGTIFKKTEKVFFYTFVFASGLAAILLPVALGFRAIVSLFDQYHNGFYYIGAFVLIMMGAMTLFEIRMPMFFSISQKPKETVDVISVFSLGIISGLTSSCCAPVLFAAITLTSLSPTLFQALIVALSYVLGIVFPLFFLSFLYERITNRTVISFKNKVYKLLKIIGALVFVVTGIAMAVLNYQGKIVMGDNASFNTLVRMWIFKVSGYFQNPLIDILVFSILMFIFYKILKHKSVKQKK